MKNILISSTFITCLLLLPSNVQAGGRREAWGAAGTVFGTYGGGAVGGYFCGPGCASHGGVIGGAFGGYAAPQIYDNPPSIPYYGRPYNPGVMHNTTPMYVPQVGRSRPLWIPE
jgi:hypothetical protein